MDFLRGSNLDPEDVWSDDDHDEVIDSPPPIIGQDERRMQVRAYNFWASLLGNRRFPSPDSLTEYGRPDFSPNSVLLRFDEGIDDPQVVFLGEALAAECGEDHTIHRLSDVPGRSVLSRITDHYLQIIANEAPIGFEAEFVNQHGLTILYRGILLPFSSTDETIDHIYGVINWKELADQHTTDALMVELGQALEEQASVRRPAVPAHDRLTLGSWADGPAASVTPLSPTAFAEEDSGDGHDDIPLDLAPYVENRVEDDFGTFPPPAFEPVEEREPRSLSEWLETARASAQRARATEDRTRQALYAAIERTWDFALAARAAPDDYARLIAEAGLVAQDRAPLIPLMKLVFGTDYDKTRLTEYATVLAHAERIGLGRGELAAFLTTAPGGLKGVIAIERSLRRGGAAVGAARRREMTAVLRALPSQPLASLAQNGAEFALVMVRRMPDGDVRIVGEIADDEFLLTRAARHFTD
ncbi:hypothetical protein [Novosphingobium nitrogenifigens]|nr:hypothetical protein [Novosphingobium nitrogenifigens]